MPKEPVHPAVGILLPLALIIPSAAYSAWVSQFLWTWFVEPVTALPTPDLWIMAGFLTAIRYPFLRYDVEPMTADRLTGMVFFAITAPAGAFAIGWVFQLLAN